MSERIITDSRGQRWDVAQGGGHGDVVFRHQSGNELRSQLPQSLDALTTEQLLSALDAARRHAGMEEVGRGGIDVSFDDDGYETGR